jgi:type II secretory pathway component PulJ
MKAGRPARRAGGFTLLEVALAMAIFFASVFVILELVSGSLRIARQLQQPRVDITAVAAHIALTNRLTEGEQDAEPLRQALGPLAVEAGFDARGYVEFARSNGLYTVRVEVFPPQAGAAPAAELDLLLFRPDTATGTGLGGAAAGAGRR